MMIKHVIIITGFLFFISCNNTRKEKTGNTKDSSVSIIINSSPQAFVSGCYQMLIKEDTAQLELITDGKNVTGNLYYNWKEKDDNKGTIKGIINDSLLFAYYTFSSEGTISVREVMFKKRGDLLFQGYGELITGSDTARFKYPRLVIFDYKHPFLQIRCK